MTRSLRPVLLFLLTFVAAHAALPSAFAADDEALMVTASPYDVPKTVDRLVSAAKNRGASVLAKVDHAASAEKSGLALRPMVLVLIGNPKLGTLLMQSRQTAGLDLPLRVLVWQDASGTTQIGYAPPASIATNHGITDRNEVIEKMTGALAAITREAVAP